MCRATLCGLFIAACRDYLCTMIWIMFFALTAAAVMSALWPLAFRRQLTTQPEAAVNFYKSQVAAIDRDCGSGLMSGTDAVIARNEAARRLLAASGQETPRVKIAPPGAVRIWAALALISIPAFSIAFYGRLGHPELPDAPLSTRLAAPPESMDVPALIAKLEAEVAARPNDGRGYALLAPIYMRLNRPGDAGKTYIKAMALLGESAELRSDYAETLVAEAQGSVTPEARAEFDAATKLDPSAPKARFYIGLAAEQAGDKPAALDIFRRLVADAPAGAPYVQSVNYRIMRLGGAAPSVPPAAAIAALPDAERDGAIRSMVEGLAARLAQNGQDEAGWLRLIRAFSVLHEETRAKTAVADAFRSMAADPQAVQRIGALAKELGLAAP